ncbi:hypothetical protein Q5P01_005178 [Channa striata]|uniref:Uncharacterized protein n=1 Tax=Channa striata TaxID=64152 RepID=A0AA88NH50_CHASR|nr:hypothetical protein Q5P01_005178 [Channa striata]
MEEDEKVVEEEEEEGQDQQPQGQTAHCCRHSWEGEDGEEGGRGVEGSGGSILSGVIFVLVLTAAECIVAASGEIG